MVWFLLCVSAWIAHTFCAVSFSQSFFVCVLIWDLFGNVILFGGTMFAGITLYDADTYKDLFGNVVLSGGTTMSAGITMCDVDFYKDLFGNVILSGCTTKLQWQIYVVKFTIFVV